MSTEDPTVRDERGVPTFARGYEGFPGRVGRTESQSQRAWPRERRAPQGAPNIVLVLVDDMGFSDIAPFGAEIDTPNLDRLAGAGVRLTNYHTTPVCSPARAAVLTGLNPHRAGFATVANSDSGFPAQRLELAEDVLTLPEILRGAGYATFAVGKWHLTRDGAMHDGAEQDSWPVQRGFDRYYGTLEGFNSFFHPNRLICDNSPVDRDELPPDYYLTDDLTDRALAMVKGLRANDSRRPFFLYFAHHAMHGPLGAKPVDLARHRGRYDIGWDEVRRRRHAKQVAEKLFPAHLPLPPRNTEPGFDVPAWADLPPAQQQLFARYMEVYAAMVDSVDQSLGRLLATLDELGEADNTIVVFTSDNGGTAEGGPVGTRSYLSQFVRIPGIPPDWDGDVDRDPELIGGPRTMVHYPRGWGMASNTPFRLYKGQTFAGGVRVPLLLSWPAGLRRAPDDDGIRHQYQYVTDVLPTLLELAGVESPGVRHGVPTKSVDGVSMAAVVRDAAAQSAHVEQYAEFGGNRGFYRDGWKIVTSHRPGTPFDDAEWQLYDVARDPFEVENRAAAEPVRARELASAWEREAWRNTVFPLSERIISFIRRPAERELERPVRLLPGTPKLERYRSNRLVTLRSFAVEIELSFTAGDAGILVAHGDQGGGYAVYVEDDRLHLAYNEYGRLHEVPAAHLLDSGDHVVRLEAEALPDFAWHLAVTVDGAPSLDLGPVPMLVGLAPFSGIDVGVNRGGPVHWDLYERHGSFRYPAGLRAVTYHPGAQAAYDPMLVNEVERDSALVRD